VVRDLRLLVFDWDGTLMDSIGAILACTRQALADAGLAPAPDATLKRAIGMGLHESFQSFHPLEDSSRHAIAVERYRHHWLNYYKDHPVLFPGVAQTVAELRDRGYLVAIATAKSRRGLERELVSTGLQPYVHASRTLDEAPPKPHPQMLLDLIGELEVTPEQTLMIGDTTYDLEMARHAGVRAVGVLSGSHDEAELREEGPLACLPSVVDLPLWLMGEAMPTQVRSRTENA
jgi:phosphoglycolate phosphatase